VQQVIVRNCLNRWENFRKIKVAVGVALLIEMRV